MPSGVSVGSVRHAAAELIPLSLFDFGGVLTTPVWDSFAAFCEGEGLDPATIKDLFRSDPEALALLRKLETGEMSEDEFEAHFGAKLGLEDHPHLIDSMFAGHGPARADGPGGARPAAAGTTTAPRLQLVEHGPLRPRPAGRALRRGA